MAKGKKISREYAVILLLAALVGGVSGGIVARLFPAGERIAAPTDTATSTPSTSEPVFLRLEPESEPNLVPPRELLRRAVSVGTLYRRPRGATPETRTLNRDRELGQAAALTSDGWFVTVEEVIEGLATTELALWYDGASYAIERMTRDSLNGTVFFKVSANNLPSPVFGSIEALLPGSEAWLERAPRSFDAAVIRTLRLDETLPMTQSSEIAYRRLTVSATTASFNLGAPLWDPRGALLGLLETHDGESVIIPSNTIAASFASLLSQDDIRHASLGVDVRDLSAWRIDGDRGELPSRGALVLSVDRSGAAALAGVRVGDVIQQVERDILDGTADLGELLSEFQPGAVVSLRVLRDGEERTVSVTLGTEVTGTEIR